MIKAIICLASIVLMAMSSNAQNFNTPVIKSKDSTIITDIINPAVDAAKQLKKEPDWAKLTATITSKYHAGFADRTVTKAKIYYYYGKDWALFCAGIVHYTEVYEDKEDLKLMNKNAVFILKYSDDQNELKTARKWMVHAVAKEPGNATYQATFKALSDKII